MITIHFTTFVTKTTTPACTLETKRPRPCTYQLFLFLPYNIVYSCFQGHCVKTNNKLNRLSYFKL